jgi:hypothetical protein
MTRVDTFRQGSRALLLGKVIVAKNASAKHERPVPALDEHLRRSTSKDNITREVTLAGAYLRELVNDVLVLLAGDKERLDAPQVEELAQEGRAGGQAGHGQHAAWLHVHLKGEFLLGVCRAWLQELSKY